MPFNTLGVATAVTPSVIETYFSHYLNRSPLKQKPTAHISYHEGLRLIRQFLDYSSKHPVEDLQTFTAQWVPVPTWVRTVDVEVPPQFLTRSANILKNQLRNLDKVGGEKWWQWRRPETPLHAEWIEMKKDFNERNRAGTKCDRVILYIHGGAYYFGSVDEHRYQMQRHARKLKARVLAPRYRLAPQFPFPCGLHDCIATYFYLLEHFEPSQILFAGDSAGGGMVLSMLVTLRDQGCPLPAGTILLSPWVDLTHSFPSTAGDGALDYIPSHGFHHKPSMIWPPPPGEDEARRETATRKFTQPVEQPFDVVELPASVDGGMISRKSSRDDLRVPEPAKNKPIIPVNQIPGMGPRLEITIDDKLVILREQIQLYARNALLTHPLVSPVQQPSLGGLPPMLIQTGGGELLRDEQIYIAHKAANPRRYPPSEAIMAEWDPQRTTLNQYPPTDVQLQVWEDLCHVPQTLSFTRPAKYMYRSVAQFGAWALARAQHKGIEIPDDDAVSIISNGSENDKDERPISSSRNSIRQDKSFGVIGSDGVSAIQRNLDSIGAIGKAGDDLPPFRDHMIRQRVDRHGIVFPLPRPEEIDSLHLDPASIGAIKAGPVRKWLAKRAESEQKYASDYKKIAKKRAKEQKAGYDPMEAGESPPYTALVSRRKKGAVEGEKKKGKSWGLAMWTGWGSSHDENTLERGEKVEHEREEAAVSRPVSRLSAAPTYATSTRGGTSTPTQRQDYANGNTLAVPSEIAETETKKQRRRSSATVFSKTSASSKKEKDTDAYAAFKLASGLETKKKVKDRGQASGKSNGKGSTPTPSVMSKGKERVKPSSSFDRSETVSPALTSRRSGSILTAKTSMETLPQSPKTLPRAPTISETAKEPAVRVPGSQNTYLDPESSRPHNGTVAYPFKLRNDEIRPNDPNASTMTLDSTAETEQIQPFPVSRNRDSSIPNLNGGIFAAAVELPTDLKPAKQGEARGSTSGSGEIVAQATSDATAAQATNPPPIFGRDRPVSIPHNDPALQYIRNLNIGDTRDPLRSDPNTPISPIEGSTAFEASTSSTSIPYNSKSQKQIRDSRLGNLGADGMPLSAFNWRTPPPPVPLSEAHAAAAAQAVPVDVNGSGNGNSGQAFFKVRNPVYDARAPAASESDVAVAASPTTTPATAPFKMRHVIYDTKVAPPGSRAPSARASAEQPSTAPMQSGTGAQMQDTEANTTGLTRSEPAASPVDNVTMPTTLSSRPIALQADNTGTFRPPPPLKDSLRQPPNRAPPPHPNRGFSTEKELGNAPPPRDHSTTAPVIGDFSFEKEDKKAERPPLETFVTASEALVFEGKKGQAF